MMPLEPLSRHTTRKGEVLVFRDVEALSEYAADMWRAISEEAIREKGRFTAALSGGRSPIPLYRRLADIRKTGYWEKAHLFIVDERFVPFDAARSNYGMIRETLLDHVHIPDAHLHPIRTDAVSPVAAAEQYERDLISFFGLKDGGLPVFDIMLLGMGEDGHTASLFPGTEALSETHRLAVAVTPPDRSKKERVSITFPVINNADHIIFEVAGAGKAGALRDVLQGTDSLLPASRVAASQGRLSFLIDEAAAGTLFAPDKT